MSANYHRFTGVTPAPEPLPVGGSRTNTWYPDEPEPAPVARRLPYPSRRTFAAAELAWGVCCAAGWMTWGVDGLQSIGMPYGMAFALCLIPAFVYVVLGGLFARAIMEREVMYAG